MRFYGSKDALFRDVMALPPVVAEAIAGLADGPRRHVGRRLAELDRRDARESAIARDRPRSHPLGRPRIPTPPELVRETVTRDIGRLVAAVTDDEPETRAVLVGSQIVGLALARHVVRVEPLASMPAADVIDYLAPIFQHYLVEPLRG